MVSKIIRNYIAKMVAGRSDDGIMITLKDPQRVEFQTAMMQDLLMRRGIDPMAIQSEDQLKMIINQIKPMEKAEDAAQSGIRNTESAKIFNRAGEELDPNKPIVGGTQTGKSIDQDTFRRLAETNTQRIKQKIADKKIESDEPPPGSRGGPDDIAAPVQSAEETLKNMTEAEIKANLEAQNKKGIENILKRKNREDVYGLEDYDTTNMSEIKKEIIRTETKLGNLNPDDPNFRAKAKPLVDKIESLKNKMRDEKADGGRIGFFKGAVAGGGNISPGTDTKGNVRDDNPFTGGGEDNNQPPQTKQTLTTTQTKDNTKKNILKTIGGFAFNRFLNSMGVPTKDIQKAIAIKGILEQAGGLIFPEGDLQNIKATSPDQRTYNIEATKDMVENLPGGLVKDIVAPAGALVMSPVYDTFQGIQRGLEDPNKSVLQAIKDENILSSAVERFTGAAAPLAERFEEGGIARIGLKDGMNRRTFLKFLAGAASIPIVGKILKPFKIGKTVTKVPIIKTDNVPGKPEWFDQLVNKVIIEGDEVTKRFATKDREIVHMKKIDDDNTVMVYQDLDEGAVRVDYDAPSNMGEDTVSLQYKKPLPDEGDPRPTAEFEASELEPRYVGGPEDADIEFDGSGGGSSIKMLESDVSKLKEYATGQKQTLKEFIESKKRKDAVKRINEDTLEQAEYISGKYGDGPEPPDDIDFASGGIARMLGE